MSSLIATVRMDMGKGHDNPQLSIYQHTDIHVLIMDFIKQWKLPNFIRNTILQKIEAELESQNMLLESKCREKVLGKQEAKRRKSGESYINLPLQQQKTVIKCFKKAAIQDIYTPIQRLKPQFKETQGRGNSSFQNQLKPKSLFDDKSQPNIQTNSKTSIKLREQTQPQERKASQAPSSFITFRNVIELRIREIFRNLRGKKYKDHKYLIPEVIECKLCPKAFQVWNQFLELLEEEDFYSLDENKFTKLVFEKKLASKFYAEFKF